jgi:hypothetical protein
MAKLGYTWYPKDWGNSEKVFELNLIERGLYRELIDMAMLCDNKIEVNINVWVRKFGSNTSEINAILDTLKRLKLIEFNNDILFIPSCESRLNLVRGGSAGGKKSKPKQKPNSKPIPKPFESFDENSEKPIANQREKKGKENEIENEIEKAYDFISNNMTSDFETFLMQNKKEVKDFNLLVETFNDKMDIELDQGKIEFTAMQLMSRFKMYARAWISNQTNDKPKHEAQEQKFNFKGFSL